MLTEHEAWLTIYDIASVGPLGDVGGYLDWYVGTWVEYTPDGICFVLARMAVDGVIGKKDYLAMMRCAQEAAGGDGYIGESSDWRLDSARMKFLRQQIRRTAP